MTTAKVVQVSEDSGSTWLTLPGGTGELSHEAGQVDDTIFGQEYQSNHTGMISWNANANAIYKGYAGYSATIKKAGSATAMTAEAMTLVSGKTYRVTNTAKRILDSSDTFIVYDNGVDQTDEVQSYNYLFGEVTFKSSYSVTGPVTITGDYLPTTAFGNANQFTLTQTAETIETSDFATAQGNGGYRTFQQGLKTVSIEMSGFYNVSAALRTALKNRTTLIIEINPDGAGNAIARGFFKASAESQSGDVGALEEETVSFVLQVPSSDYIPFGWFHDSDTTLHDSVLAILDAWTEGTEIDVKYLYDGTNGISGGVIVTDVSLSGGLDAMNTFNANFQGTGATTEVGTG